MNAYIYTTDGKSICVFLNFRADITSRIFPTLVTVNVNFVNECKDRWISLLNYIKTINMLPVIYVDLYFYLNTVIEWYYHDIAWSSIMVMWSPSQTVGFPLGTTVTSHTIVTSVPTSIINISCITCFIIVVKV